jgi:hypothetical protein
MFRQKAANISYQFALWVEDCDSLVVLNVPHDEFKDLR